MSVESTRFLQTEDGSWTLTSSTSGEAMHSRQGAFSETWEIYGSAIDKVFERVAQPSFLVLGLGLGYIELAIAAKGLHRSFNITSFESEPTLTKYFLLWLEGAEGVPESFQRAYLETLASFERKTKTPGETIKKKLWSLYQEKVWSVEGAFKPELCLGKEFHGILYDAYSKRTTPELWEQKNLEEILNASSSPSIFATYASQSQLKKTLIKRGYTLSPQGGFGKKRESTLAILN